MQLESLMHARLHGILLFENFSRAILNGWTTTLPRL
jgi:hypothetical protein